MEEFNKAGIRPVAISVDSPEVSSKLKVGSGLTFTFLADPGVEAIRRFDLVHSGGGIDGQDISRPAEFLLDAAGTVRWVNLTENYWVRARPEQVLEAAKALQ